MFRLLAALFLFAAPLRAGTLLRHGFETVNPWPSLAGFAQAATGSITATATYSASSGTINTYGSGTASGGLQLVVDSAAAAGVWSARLDSGVLDLLEANSRGLPFLTLAFSLSASTAHPVRVRLESYDAAATPARTGGLSMLIFPAAPDFYQRFALDLDKMTPDGDGAFDPSAPKVRLSFEIEGTGDGIGWPAASGHTLKIDNLHYATPKYYVKPAAIGGSNSATGLAEASALATVQNAADKAAPGDIIAIMGGADYTSSGDLVTLTKAGAPDAWIVFKNYPGDLPVLTCTSWNVFKLTNSGANAAAYLEIRGLVIRGQSYVDANGDRRLASALEPYVGLVDGRGNGNGIFVEGRNSAAAKPRHIRIADNTVEYLAGGGIGTANADRVTIENNLVRYNCWWMIYAGSGISHLAAVNTETGSGYRMLIQGNTVYGNETMVPWYSAGTNFSDGNGIIVDSYDAAYAGRTLVAGNLAYGNGGSGIHVLKSSNTDIVHNTACFNSASPNLNYGQIFTQSIGASAVNNVRLANNVLFARRNPTGVSSYLYNLPATSVAAASPATIFHWRNVYAGGDLAPPLSGANFSDNADLGRTASAAALFISPSTDPLAADFRLRASAAARNYGVAVGYRAARDLAGTPRSLTGATDGGAYQTVANLAYSPLFIPAAGNYAAAQSVTLASDTAGASIIYTTDGGTPTVDAAGAPTRGALYSGSPIAVSTATTLKAIAWKAGLATSPVSTAPYTFQNLAAVPVTLSLDKTTGIHSGTRVVQALTRTPGAYASFTTNGTDPTATTGTPQEYRGYTVTDHAALRYRAFKPGRAPSAVVIAAITVRASLGNTADGAAFGALGAHRIRFVRFQASDTFSAAYLFARIQGLTGNYRAAIYSDNNAAPGTRLAVSALVTNPATGWKAFPLAVRVTLAKNSLYWLAIWSDTEAAALSASSTGGTVREVASTFSTTWPATAGTTTAGGTANYAIYATNAPPNLAPLVGAGIDQAVASGAAAALSGGVGDDGVPVAPGAVTSVWSQISGPGVATFANAASALTTATFSADGAYVLRLTATDALATSGDEVTITVGENVPPPTPHPDAVVLYRETFGNSTASVTRLNAANVAWSQYVATSDTAHIANTAASATYGGVATQTGRPVELANVNAGVSDSQTNGFGFNQNGTRALVFTTEYPVDRALHTPDFISWYSHVSSTSGGANTQSAAVRIAGQWYVTAPANNLTVVGSAATFGASATVCGVSFANADWRTLAATVGAPFSVGVASVPLPDGPLEAFGIYFTTAGVVTTRFDSFTLTAVPVPPPATPLSIWRANHFTPAELDDPALEATRWGDLADPDGDGLVNLLEYALAADPLAPGAAFPVVDRDPDGALALSFLRARADLVYSVEAGSDLADWDLVEVNPGVVGEVVRVPDHAPPAGARRFMRLRVALP